MAFLYIEIVIWSKYVGWYHWYVIVTILLVVAPIQYVNQSFCIAVKKLSIACEKNCHHKESDNAGWAMKAKQVQILQLPLSIKFGKNYVYSLNTQ